MPKKGLLQRISKISGVISLIIAVAIVGGLFFTYEEGSKVYRASMGASVFFFFMVGIVLIAMGNAQLPNLKIDLNDKNK